MCQVLFGFRCPICERSGSRLCPSCERRLRPARNSLVLAGVDISVSCFRYDTIGRPLILAAKNGARRDLLRLFADRLVDPVWNASHQLSSATSEVTVTWLPASRDGIRKRGFDQAEVLARRFSRKSNTKAKALLIRSGGSAQTGRSRADRLIGPDLRAACSVEGTVIVIDDVLTTGASMSAAAEILRQSGASQVIAATVATV